MHIDACYSYSPPLKTVHRGDLHPALPQAGAPHASLKSLNLVAVGCNDAYSPVEVSIGEGVDQFTDRSQDGGAGKGDKSRLDDVGK